MRHKVLMRSVRRWIGPTEADPVAVLVWFSHRLMLPYAVGSGAAVAGLAAYVGVQSAPSVGALGLFAAALASMATTEHRILAYAGSDLIVLRTGRVRQVAVGIAEQLPVGTTVERIGGNLITSEWRVDDRVYTTYRRSDMVLAGIAMKLS